MRICLLILFAFGHFFADGQLITTYAGTTTGFSGDGGPATAARISAMSCITFDGAGNGYISDSWNYRIRKVNSSGIISTVVGIGTPGFSGDGGAASAAELKTPTCVAVDGAGNLFIADQDNNRIRKVNTSGIISTIAGTGIIGSSGDGG